MPDPRPLVILLAADLMSGGPVRAAAKAAEAELVAVRSADAAAEAARQAGDRPVRVVVDLTAADAEHFSPADHPAAACYAFGPHVDADALRRARQRGYAEVVPRSRLGDRLPTWLT